MTSILRRSLVRFNYSHIYPQQCHCGFRHYSRRASKVPSQATWKTVEPREKPHIDHDIVNHLEHLALVDFSNQEGVDRLTKAIEFANQLQDVDTTGVEPMDTVLEDISLNLRKDEITEGNCRDDILKNATKTMEEYFLAPPGNIPLEKKNKDYGMKSNNSDFT